MTKKILQFIASALSVFLLALIFSSFYPLSVSAVKCGEPIALQPEINTQYGYIDLDWQPSSGVKRYYVEVYGYDSKTKQRIKVKEWVFDSPRTYARIHDNELACGNYEWRVRAECCDGNCVTCKDDILSSYQSPTTQCQALQQVWGVHLNDLNSCMCSDPTYHTQYKGSNLYKTYPSGGTKFYYKNSDGTHTDSYNKATATGCCWSCFGAMTNEQIKDCCIDYKLKCASNSVGGAHKTLIDSTDTITKNVCALDDGRMLHLGVDYDRRAKPLPPYAMNPKTFTWNWSCDESCVACRRAECGPLYGQIVKEGETIDKNRLCVGTKDGKLTSVLKPMNDLNPNDDGYIEWDCIGAQDCGVSNQNHISPDQKWLKVGTIEAADNNWARVDKCRAPVAMCGKLNKTHRTKAGFDKVSSQKAQLCYGNGRVANLNYYSQQARNIKVVPDPFTPSYVEAGWKWDCIYGDGSEEQTVKCEAFEVDCKNNKENCTANSFDQFKNFIIDADKSGYNPKGSDFLCRNGETAYLYEGDGVAAKDVPPSGWNAATNQWTWSCFDDAGNEAQCGVYKTMCAEPPHKAKYANLADMTLKTNGVLCKNGKATVIKTVEDPITKDVRWEWTCEDDCLGSQDAENCYAEALACSKTLNKQYFDNWDDFEKHGASCGGGKPDDAKRTCTNVCNDPKLSAEVTKDDKGFAWVCGDIECDASINDCKEPPHNNYYFDDSDFLKDCKNPVFVGLTMNCGGVCTDPSARKDITSDDNGWSWQCGDKKCLAKRAACGVSHLNGAISTAQRADTYKPENLCAGGGTPIFRTMATNANGKYIDGQGHTTYGHVFEEDEGSIMWQCDYGNGKIFPRLSTSGDYYFDTAQNKKFCYTWEHGNCPNIGSGTWNLTINQFREIYNPPYYRGYRKLCEEGVVSTGINGIFRGKNFDTNLDSAGNAKISKDKANKLIYWWCDGGMGKDNARKTHDGKTADSDVCLASYIGCKTPPDGKSYTQSEFNALKDAQGRVACENGKKSQWNSQTNNWDIVPVYYYGTPTLTTNGWIWDCEGDTCSANLSKCAEPPYGGTYGDAEFAALVASGALCAPTTTASNLATTTTQWTWKCGTDNCYAKRGCTKNVSIKVAPKNKICANSNAIFSVDQNECASVASYAWKKNGVVVASTTAYSTTGIVNNDVISLEIDCNDSCLANRKIISNSILMTIDPPTTHTAGVNGNNDQCIGQPSQLTAYSNCSNFSTVWKLGNIPVSYSNPLPTSTVAVWSTPGVYSLSAEVTCNLDCYNPKIVTTSYPLSMTSSSKAIGANISGDLCSGSNRTLNASAGGYCNVKQYRWKLNNGLWSAWSTTAPYTFTTLINNDVVYLEVKCADSGNCNDTTATSTATNIVNSKKVDTVTINEEACSGSNKTLSATATGNCTNKQYRWSTDNINWTTWSSSSSNTFSSLSSGNVYVQSKCVDSGSCTDNTAASASKAVTTSTKITGVGINENVCSGTNKTLTATASGSCTNKEYSWSSDNGLTWSPWSSSNSYTYPALTSSMNIALRARCVDTGTCNDNTPIAIGQAVTATTKVDTVSLSDSCSGNSKTITASTTGSCTNKQYRWKLNNGTWTSWATGSSYTFPTLAVNDIVYVESKCIDATPCNDATAATANKTVTAGTKIDSVVINENACSGTNKTFTATATGNCTNKEYRWSTDANTWTTWSSSNSNTFANLTSGTVVYVQSRCNDSGFCNDATGVGANKTTDATTQVQSVTLSGDSCSGNNKVLTANTTGVCTTKNYRWKLNNGAWSSWSTSSANSFPTLAINDIVYVEAKCVDSSNCNIDTTASNSITITGTRKVDTVAINEQPLCSGTNITATASTTGSCTNKEFRWSSDGMNWTSWSNSSANTFPSLASGTLAYVQSRCNDSGSCNDSTSVSATRLITASSKINSVVIDQNPCSGTNKTLSATTVGTCTNKTYRWSSDNGSTWTAWSNSNSNTFTNLATSSVVIVQAKCEDTGCNDNTSASNSKTVNPGTKIDLVTLPSPICHGNNKTVNCTATGNCTNKQYSWSIDGGSTWSAWSSSSSNTFSSLVNGTYLWVKSRCNDSGSCNDAAAAMDSELIAETHRINTVSINENACAGNNKVLTATATGTCTNKYYRWSVNGTPVGTWSISPSKTFTSLSTNDVVTLEAKCEDTGCNDNTPASANKTVDPATQVDSVTLDSVICSGTNKTVGAISLGNCTNKQYRWKINNGSWSAWTATASYTSNLNSADVVYVEAKCNDSGNCNISTSVASSSAAVDCGCGSADGKSYTATSFFTSQRCGSGATVVNWNDTDEDKWTWKCRNGGVDSQECKAYKVRCNSASDGFGNKTMTSSKYTSQFGTDRLCKRGVAKNNDGTANATATNLASYFNYGTDYAVFNDLIDKWQWRCYGDGGASDYVGGANCQASAVSCGIASAEQNAAHNRPIQPLLSSVYYGSFDGSGETNFLSVSGKYCTNTIQAGRSDSSPNLKANKGEYYWKCYGDDETDAVECQARRDCGWSCQYSGTCPVATDMNHAYPTIDYSTATSALGCWTAKNVLEKPTSNNPTNANHYWIKIFNKALGTSTNQINWDFSSTSIKYTQGQAIPIGIMQVSTLNSGSNNQGICPEGFRVPWDVNWHNLEVAVGSNSSCLSNRLNFNLNNSGQPLDDNSGCSPAGASNQIGYSNDGLRNPYGFNGVSGESYWTDLCTYPTVRANTPVYRRNYNTTYPATSVTCGQNVLPGSTQVVTSGPYYIGLETDDNVHRKVDLNWCGAGGGNFDGENARQLRCVKIINQQQNLMNPNTGNGNGVGVDTGVQSGATVIVAPNCIGYQCWRDYLLQRRLQVQ